VSIPVTQGGAFLTVAEDYPTAGPPVQPALTVAFTVLYAQWPVDQFLSEVAGVAPILPTGTEVDDTLVAAVQAAATAAFGHPLATSAGGGGTSGTGAFGNGPFGAGPFGGT
jgi:hypothetical protein